MKTGLVSVIIPAYNCEKTVETALRAILDQTYTNTEIIVVDDNSTDKTASVVREIMRSEKKIRLVRAETDDPYRYDATLQRNINAGYSARNTGLSYAEGEFVTFQDADDGTFTNRIEVLLGLLHHYNAVHVSADWIQFDERLVGKRFNSHAYLEQNPGAIIEPEKLYALSQQTKGIALKLLGSLHSQIPFSIKRKRVLNKLFFGSLTPYPGAPSAPLFRREVLEKVHFRKLSEREWPSFMGRGADRDFNFKIAETFKNSYAFLMPLHLWRVKTPNQSYGAAIEPYIL